MSYVTMIQQSYQPSKDWKAEKKNVTSAFEETKNTAAANAGSSGISGTADAYSPEANSVPECSVTPGNDECTFEEYKLSIYNKISGYAKNASGKGGGVFIDISDECLIAMKNDKAYESWVLENVQKAYAAPPCSGYDTYTFLKFGAAQDDFSQESYSFPDRKTQERLRKINQEQKESLKKKRRKMLEKKMQEEKWKRQAWQSAYVQLKIQEHRMQLKEENEAILAGESFQRADHDSSLRAAAKRKVLAYESTFLYSGISF